MMNRRSFITCLLIAPFTSVPREAQARAKLGEWFRLLYTAGYFIFNIFSDSGSDDFNKSKSAYLESIKNMGIQDFRTADLAGILQLKSIGKKNFIDWLLRNIIDFLPGKAKRKLAEAVWELVVNLTVSKWRELLIALADVEVLFDAAGKRVLDSEGLPILVCADNRILREAWAVMSRIEEISSAGQQLGLPRRIPSEHGRQQPFRLTSSSGPAVPAFTPSAMAVEVGGTAAPAIAPAFPALPPSLAVALVPPYKSPSSQGGPRSAATDPPNPTNHGQPCFNL